MILAGAALIDTLQHTPKNLTDVIQDMVKESLSGIELPTTKPKRRRGRKDVSPNNKKRKKVNYERERAYNCVMADYLGPVPIFNDRQFEQVFRITNERVTFVISSLAKYDDFWTVTYDALGKQSIAPEVKFLAAQKRLCYGVSFSAFQDYF